MIPAWTTFPALALAFALLSAGPLPAHDTGGGSPYAGNVRVTTLMKTSTNNVGQPIAYPRDRPAEVSILIVEIPPGQQTGWHRHPVPIFGYVLAGQVTVHFANGEKHTYREGDTLAEAVNVLHNGVNDGNSLTRLLIFVAGEKGEPFTIKKSKE